MKKFSRWIAIAALICPLLGWGAPKERPDRASVKQKVQKSVDEQVRVSLTTNDGRRLQGYVSEARPDDFTLGNEGTSTTLKYSDVSKINVAMSRGKRIGIALAVSGAIVGTSAALAHH